MDYKLPTEAQIFFSWDVRPSAQVVARVLREFADKQDDKSQSVTISKETLASMTNQSESGVTAALAELRSAGFLEDTPGKYPRAPHHYRLHNSGNHKSKKVKWADVFED